MKLTDRELYCGYLGLMDNDNTEIFVNLRCAKIYHNKLSLYVGGGITAESNPEDEFHETEIKAETLLSVIKNIEICLMTSASYRVQVLIQLLEEHVVKHVISHLDLGMLPSNRV